MPAQLINFVKKYKDDRKIHTLGGMDRADKHGIRF